MRTETMRYNLPMAHAVLTRTPSVFRSMLIGLPHEWLTSPEKPGAWSPHEIACHVADLEHDAWLPRIHAIVDSQWTDSLPNVNRERFRERYTGVSLEEVLHDFSTVRAANLVALGQLQLDDATLATTGTHSQLGTVRLSHLLSTWVVHDLTHMAQINRTMASRYRSEVGPWADLLSILRLNPTTTPQLPDHPSPHTPNNH